MSGSGAALGAGGMSSGGVQGYPTVRPNPDGSVSYDSSHEPEANARFVEQAYLPTFPAIPGTLDKMVSTPNPVDEAHCYGSHDDLLTTTCLRPDSDDFVKSFG